MVVEKMEYIVVCGRVYLDIDFSIELLANVATWHLSGAKTLNHFENETFSKKIFTTFRTFLTDIAKLKL